VNASPLTMGPRDTGTYELDVQIHSADLAGGDPNGATVGFGLKDSTENAALFLVRLNKTTGGLAVSTYIDAVYNQLRVFNGIFSLSEPLRIRSVIDLGARHADVFLTEGSGAESFVQQVPLSSVASTWDQLQYTALNNSTDWGPGDTVKIDSLAIRKLYLDSYALFEGRFDWQGEVLTAEEDDPDGDGISNFMEWALGGDPITSSATPALLDGSWINGLPHVVFRLGVDSIDLSYFVEQSEDLMEWGTLSRVQVHGQAGDQILIPLVASPPTCFARVSVLQRP
jgi:hypothetical protein